MYVAMGCVLAGLILYDCRKQYDEPLSDTAVMHMLGLNRVVAAVGSPNPSLGGFLQVFIRLK